MSSFARRWPSALRRILLETCSSGVRCAVSPEGHRSDPHRLKSSRVTDTASERTTMKTHMRTMITAGALLVGFAIGTHAQSLSYNSGQGVAPAYEGWEETVDGVKYFLFGYMNRNWEEEIDLAVGPQNAFSPGASDLGQPTHFLPRRNRFVFNVPVPPNSTEKDELVWTLTAHGNTEKAYA